MRIADEINDAFGKKQRIVTFLLIFLIWCNLPAERPLTKMTTGQTTA